MYKLKVKDSIFTIPKSNIRLLAITKALDLKANVEWIAPVTVYPGEDELLALAQGAIRVLSGEEEATIENEIRCNSGHPHMYSTSTEPLNIDAIRSFFKVSNSFSEFKKQFGHPNAENIYCYYELPIESGEHRYLQIGTDSDKIYGATVVNEFEYIETIYNKND